MNNELTYLISVAVPLKGEKELPEKVENFRKLLHKGNNFFMTQKWAQHSHELLFAAINAGATDIANILVNADIEQLLGFYLFCADSL